MDLGKVVITLKEKEEKVKDLRPIDDVFFEVLANDVNFCQEMLQILLEDKNLVVKDVVVQSSERNLYGRSVRLDALCVLGNGKKCNVEVQRSDNDDHLRRVRFNAASIAVKDCTFLSLIFSKPIVYYTMWIVQSEKRVIVLMMVFTEFLLIRK